ncbi:unnamed protein product [Brassicogethes aeneus]|uniref:Serine/threonine-protein kinase RIO3 n=1 Tax=Brassicogethes aeneus TaxID=1431903 RepID=A0A9P0FMK6_BRAAE|nr:unnamed protein product [Brassicogethes aeneus]
MSCPWAKIEKPEPVNFEDIMSEEVARDLQAKEEKKSFKNVETTEEVKTMKSEENIPVDVLKAISSETYESDEMIAKMLQMQFNKEYDDNLQRTAEKYNGGSKVSVSFENYKRAPYSFDFESDSEEEEITDILDRKDWDRFDDVLRKYNDIPKTGYKVNPDGSIVTKHDVDMNGRKNACKLLAFPPEFCTGDGEDFDLKISNKVFNSLKMHSKNEQARRHKFHDKKEDQATAEFGMDEYTQLILYKMINRALLDQVNGIISIGKEAVIIHADGDSTNEKVQVPKECAIKVFKTTLSEFKQRDKYIKDDHRFKNRIGNLEARKTVNLWAQKEMANLIRLKRAGIPCPDVVELKKHVLVMSFIGENHRAAPKLKDTKLTDAEYIVAYEQIIEDMKSLYQKANLVHADLSEYNILYHKKTCYFIDVSQSVEPSHLNSFHFLMRDCENITNYFTKKGVPEMKTPQELFEYIVGYSYEDRVALDLIIENFKPKPHLVGRPGVESGYNFDNAWEKSKNGELPNIDAEEVVA